jgi:hypothetical protein
MLQEEEGRGEPEPGEKRNIMFWEPNKQK